MRTPLPAVLLLPGILNDERLWRHQRQALARQAAVLVPEYGLHDTMHALAGEVLAQAPPVFALAGFSMGGYLALEILRLARRRVQALALVSSSAFADDPQQALAREKAIAAVQRGKFEKVVEGSINMALHPVPGIDSAQALMREMAASVGPEKFCAHTQAISGRIDQHGLLPNLDMPALVAVGAQDRVTPPAFSKALAERMPTADMQIIEAAGHMLPLQQPQALTAALEQWLARI